MHACHYRGSAAIMHHKTWSEWHIHVHKDRALALWALHLPITQSAKCIRLAVWQTCNVTCYSAEWRSKQGNEVNLELHLPDSGAVVADEEECCESPVEVGRVGIIRVSHCIREAIGRVEDISQGARPFIELKKAALDLKQKKRKILQLLYTAKAGQSS